jgi:hypothetical protein
VRSSFKLAARSRRARSDGEHNLTARFRHTWDDCLCREGELARE